MTFGVGIGLTNSALEAGFATVTGHQITRADFASTFSWGADIDLDGFGVTGQRHLNGTMAWAINFGNGNDSAAIQQAVNFVQSSSPGRGVVFVNALSGGARWTINSQITLYPGIHIVGIGGPILNKTVGSAIFAISNVSDGLISGLIVDGNTSSGGLAEGQDVVNFEVSRCVIGVNGDSANTRYMNGPLLKVSTGVAVSRNIRVVDNYCHENNEIAFVEDANGVVVSRNVLFSSRNLSSSQNVIDLFGVTGAVVSDNWIKGLGESGGSAGPARCISVDAGTLVSVPSRVEITNNFCWGGAGHQIYLNNATYCRVSGNKAINAGETVSPNTWDSINLDGTTSFCEVFDNVASNRPNALGSRYGIYVESTVSDCIVKDNFLENLDAAGTAATRWLCGTAGINVVSGATRIYRHGNIIIEDQYRPDVPWLNHAAANHERFTVNGIRTLAGDAARHNQVLGVRITLVRAAVTAAAPPSISWWRDPTGGGGAATKFDTANAINVNTSIADLTATAADWRLAVEVLA